LFKLHATCRVNDAIRIARITHGNKAKQLSRRWTRQPEAVGLSAANQDFRESKKT
jgi:hypothetical protein